MRKDRREILYSEKNKTAQFLRDKNSKKKHRCLSNPYRLGRRRQGQDPLILLLIIILLLAIMRLSRDSSVGRDPHARLAAAEVEPRVGLVQADAVDLKGHAAGVQVAPRGAQAGLQVEVEGLAPLGVAPDVLYVIRKPWSANT